MCEHNSEDQTYFGNDEHGFFGDKQFIQCNDKTCANHVIRSHWQPIKTNGEMFALISL